MKHYKHKINAVLLGASLTLLQPIYAGDLDQQAQSNQNNAICLADNMADDEECEQQTRGKINDDSRLFSRSVKSNTERRLPNETVTLHALAPVSSEQTPSVTKQATTQATTVTSSIGNHALHFRSGSAEINSVQPLNDLTTRLKDKKNLRLNIIGHTDSQRLSSATKIRFENNQKLSEARAKAVANYLTTQLKLKNEVVTSEGRGESEPLSNNLSHSDMAKNRRVEIQIWYDEAAMPVQSKQQSMNRSLVCHKQKNNLASDTANNNAFRVSVDGVPQNKNIESHEAHNENTQRCTDIALEKSDIRVQYDSNKQPEAVLNITASPTTALVDETIQFQGHSNYNGWITRAEVRVFSTEASPQSEPLAIITLDEHLKGDWIAYKGMPEKMHYRLRVYDQNKRFDETGNQRLWLTKEHQIDSGTQVDQEKDLLSGYGENHLELHNIHLEGGTITVHGKKIPDNHNVFFMGTELPVDDKGRFVGQQIVPEGMHNIEVAVLDNQGNGELFWRELKLEGDNWFYVGIADLTVGRNNTNGPAALVTNDSQHYNNDLYTDGRMAFYTKGKWRKKYTVTSSIDTLEQPLDDLLSNLDEKDPRALLRRLDEEDHYPVYGDDSTIHDDAPTQGKFFAKIEDDKSHLMWGNFSTHINDSEFARIERGLYGAQLLWNSNALTSYGERKTAITGFAAEPGTIAAWEELRGTGGSLYYLQHQDITQGSDQIRVEVRDKDSGLVLSSNQLIAGQDYDIDSIQGRLLLTQPLSSISDDNVLIRNSGLSGHPVFLVINYEYTPGLTELDELALGGRGSHWINDHVQLGLTSSHQRQQGSDQDLQALDMTFRYTAETYLKVEAAHTDGPGIGGQTSNNGGFTFGGIAQNRTNNIDAKAYRAEAAINLQDAGLSSTGQGTLYVQERQAGFSAPGQLSLYDTDQYGGSLTTPINETTDMVVKFDSKDEDGGIDTRAIEADVAHRISNHWTLAGGVRNDSLKQSTPTPNTDIGDRTDLTLQASYESEKNWASYGFIQGTVDRDQTRRRNNRIGAGGNVKLSDRIDLRGELSTGDDGLGAQIGTDFRLSDRSDIYLGYELNPDRSDNNIRGRNGQLVSGMKHRYSDALSVFGEGHYQHGDVGSGLTHAYGVDYAPSKEWSLGLNFETGELSNADLSTIERTSTGVNASYHRDSIKYGVALEYRRDQSLLEDRTSWLMRNNLAYQVNPDWRAQLRLDFAVSETNLGNSFNSDFTEAIVGFAYRPIHNDRFNGLFKYTYLEDLAPFDQFTASSTQGQNQQRSHVLSVDGIYDLNERWSIGGKYAYRLGELRQGRDEGLWFDSEATLLIARLDWHVVRRWDLLIEGRMLDIKAAEDRRMGALIGLYRHLNENAKIGIGYNFTDFSDDLTNQDFDSQGWFLNIIGKF